jgi:elongation factor Ts
LQALLQNRIDVMGISASLVKELRERSGAGMMECKKALVEVDGDVEAAQDLLRTRGQAKAEKKSGRIAAEGCVFFGMAADNGGAVLMEVNCETDFVARDENFLKFADTAVQLVLANDPADVDALMALSADGGGSLSDACTALVAKIGEKVSVRRFEKITPKGTAASYLHGARIGVVVDVTSTDGDLPRDIAMHIAASAPLCISADDVPAEDLEHERKILTDQALQEGKPENIVEKMVEGRLRKHLAEITLLGQPFVKDPDLDVGKLLANAGASIHSFVRYEVGEGIEKKAENFADEVAAQVEASGG